MPEMNRLLGNLPSGENLLLLHPPELERWLSMAMPEKTEAIEHVAGPVTDVMRAGVPIQVLGRTAVIPVHGMTNKRFHAPGFLASYMAVSSAINAAVADPKIANIVLSIESPGGYVTGVAEVADDIRAAAQTKHVVAQVEGLGASAAYWMASQASEIVAGRMDVVGSIGVLAVVYDVSKQAEKEGIKTEVFTTGKFKAAGVPGTSLTDEQRSEIQARVDQTGESFIADVSRGRRMDLDAVKAVADGRVFVAPQALANGLIDRIGTLGDTIMRLNDSGKREARIRKARFEVATE